MTVAKKKKKKNGIAENNIDNVYDAADPFWTPQKAFYIFFSLSHSHRNRSRLLQLRKQSQIHKPLTKNLVTQLNYIESFGLFDYSLGPTITVKCDQVLYFLPSKW